MFNKLIEEININDSIKITDIHQDFYGNNSSIGITLQTKNKNYIEIYDDGTWEYFISDED